MAYQINVVGYDGCLASAVMQPLDMFANINRSAQKSIQLTPFDVSLVTPLGQPIVCSNGVILNANAKLESSVESGALFFHINPQLDSKESTQLKSVYQWVSQRAEHFSALVTNDSVINRLIEPIKHTENSGRKKMVSTSNWYQHCQQFFDQICGEQFARTLLIQGSSNHQSIDVDASNPLHQAEKWIHENLAKPFTIEELASHMAMSSRTLIRRFQDYLGQTPQKYIQRSRIERCQMLLKTTNLTFGQIVSACGYNDENALRRVFKKAISLTPSEYRKFFSK